jgi:uncharacterized protein (TIGR02145 family)
MRFRIIIFVQLLCFIGCTSSDTDENSNVPLPLPATNLKVDGLFTNQVNLSWTDNSTNETGFKIERKIGSGNFNLIGTVGSNIITFNDSGLIENTQYVYRIYPYNQSGDSSTYSNEVSATTTSQLNMISIVIGSQIWQKNNLDVVTYRDGTPIPQITDPLQWKNTTIGAWCYYENLTPNGVEQGKLYNWYAVAGIHDNASFSNPSLRKELAPTGWHIPSENEWTILTNYLGGASVAGGKMKETGYTFWNFANGGGATNSSGFSARAYGSREYSSVFDLVGFGNKGLRFDCWSSTAINTSSISNAKSIYLLFNNTTITTNTTSVKSGYNVRCVKN